MAEWLCDGRNECEGGWDERNCCKFDGFLNSVKFIHGIYKHVMCKYFFNLF